MKKWKKFEKKTAQTIQNFNSDSKVYENVYVTGKFSKSPRQIDVKLVDPDGYDFMVFECKDKSQPIDTPVVEAFVTKLKDLGDKKGAIVSNSPYTKGAQNIAKEFNIDMLHIVDSSDNNIRTTIYATAMISDIMPINFNIGFGLSSNQPVYFDDDVRKLVFIDTDGNNITGYQIFISIWNNTEELPRTSGLHTYTVPDDRKFSILGIDGKKEAIKNLQFNYEVIQKHFFGKVEIIDTSGIYNVKEKSYRTRSLLTEPIVANEVEKIWQEIESPADIKESVTFGMHVVSMYPELSGQLI